MKPVIIKIPVDGSDLAFSPDSRFLLCGGGASVYVYDCTKRRKAFSFPMEFKEITSEYQRCTNSIAVSANGDTVAVAGNDGLVMIWDWPNRKKRFVLPAHNYKAACVAISPDGRLLASAGHDFRAKLWDLTTGKKLASFKAKRQLVDGLAFSPDSKRLAWGCEGGNIAVADIESRRELYSFRPHKVDVWAVAFSPDGRVLATASEDGTAKLFSPDSGTELLTLHGSSRCLDISADGRLLATGTNKNLLLWDLKKNKCVCALPVAASDGILCLRFSPDGQILASSGFGRRVRMWNVPKAVERGDRSHLTGRTGTVTPAEDRRPASERAAEAARKIQSAVASWPRSKGMPPPAHLRDCTVHVKSKSSATSYFGHVQCPCGSRRVHLLYSGQAHKRNGEQCPRVNKIAGDFYFVIKAKCSECMRQHLLFDMNLHGWNGFVCREKKRPSTEPKMTVRKCTACGAAEHTATVLITGETRTQAIDESYGKLDESNWQEGFGWITISVKCCECGHAVDDWVSYESM